MPTPTAWYSHAATTLQEERENSRMTADRPTPATEADPTPTYLWEPVKGDCRRHFGPHEPFRCNGAYGRLIEVWPAASDAGLRAALIASAQENREWFRLIANNDEIDWDGWADDVLRRAADVAATIEAE